MKKLQDLPHVEKEVLLDHAKRLTSAVLDIAIRDLSAKYPNNPDNNESRSYNITDQKQLDKLSDAIKNTILSSKGGEFIKSSYYITSKHGTPDLVINCLYRMSRLLKPCFIYKKQFRTDILSVNLKKFDESMVLDSTNKYFDSYRKLALESLPLFTAEKPEIKSDKTEPQAKHRMFNHKLKPLQLPNSPDDTRAVFVK